MQSPFERLKTHSLQLPVDIVRIRIALVLTRSRARRGSGGRGEHGPAGLAVGRVVGDGFAHV